MINSSSKAIAFAALLLAATGAQAVSLTSTGFIQDFDSMGAAGTTPPTDWSMLVGPSGTTNGTWTSSIPAAGVAAMIATPGVLSATTTPSGTNNNGFNAALSTVALADRLLATSPTSVSGAGVQLKLTNDTGAALSGLSVSFDTVRYTSVSSANELPGYWLFYSLDGLSWNNVSALNGNIATVPNSTGVTSASGSFAFFSMVTAGADFYLRWVDDNATQTSPDQIIGLNNVSVAAVPLPAGLPLLLSVLGGFGLFARRRAA